MTEFASKPAQIRSERQAESAPDQDPKEAQSAVMSAASTHARAPDDPRNATTHTTSSLLHLQTLVGNGTVQRLLATRITGRHNLIQRSPLSERLAGVWRTQGKGAFFAQLRQLEPGVTDDDLDEFVDDELHGDDRWLARGILRHGPEPLWPAREAAVPPGSERYDLEERRRRSGGRWTHAPIEGVIGLSRERRPITAYFYPGQTDERALVIAGVHGTERQGIEVARMLMHDLGSRRTPPRMTVIIVPSLFPDSEAAGRFGRRDPRVAGGNEVPSNRNYPADARSLAASRDTGGVARDAEGRPIHPENIALISLMERFNPSRLISIHGTHRPHRAGIFVDPVAGHEVRDRELAVAAARRVVSGIRDRERAAGLPVTEDISHRSMTRAPRDSLEFDIETRRRRHELDGRTSAELTEAERRELAATAAVAGNHLFLGAGNENEQWSGEQDAGVSLGEYAPLLGMTVYTVEPAVNRNTADYAAGATEYGTGSPERDRLSAAQRRIELQSYADAVRTVLLGDR